MTATTARTEALTEARTAAGPGDGDERDPVRRLSCLVDPGTLELDPAEPARGVRTGRGRVDGAAAEVFCTDATTRAGALGRTDGDRIVGAIERAVARGVPVVGLWHSGGAHLGDGVGSLDGMGRMFAAMTHASGRVPQLSAVLGPAAGAAAYGPALTDVVVMSADARIFVTGPDVVRSVTGEHIDMAGLGGGEVHGPRSGVAHVVVDDGAEAIRAVRRLTGLLAGVHVPADDSGSRDPSTLLPESRRRAYDVRPMLGELVDGRLDELQPSWAPNVVTGLARLEGRPIGVVANNPMRKGGCLDSMSAEKAARFVRMCDALGLGLLVVVDVPGYLPGIDEEWGGVVRRGAKLLHAFAEASVPRVTVITRKAFGGAYIAMNSRSLGATSVLAWPGAEIAVMGAEAAVEILHRRDLAAVTGHDRDALLAAFVRRHRAEVGDVRRSVALGVVDEVVEPAATRQRVAEEFARAHAGRGAHGNIPL